MDNLNNNSNNDNSNNDNINNENSNNENSNNENLNIRTFYFNPTQSNEDILQQITSFINNISNINQVNHEHNTNNIDENNNDNLGSSDGSNMNQNIQMFFEIEFLMNPENVGEDDDETSHFDDCNHINEILGKAIYIKKDDPILEIDCSICMDNYKYKQYKRILPECKHTFHKKCIDNWFKKNSSCPVCRKDFLTVQNNVS